MMERVNSPVYRLVEEQVVEVVGTAVEVYAYKPYCT